MLIHNLVKSAIQNNGITYNPITRELNPSVGYMVSLNGFEEKHAELDEDIVWNYMMRNSTQLCPTNYIGLWKDGVWHVDISVHILDLGLAIKVGQKNEQKAIWDCANGETIYLSTIKQ